MTTLTVGSGQQYATIKAAVAAAKYGDTINIQAGTYTNDFPGQINGLTLQGVGGIVKLVATEQPANGKAYLDVAGTTTLRNLDISGITVPDGNGAAIRYEGGTLLIQNSIIHGNQDGILGAADSSGSITIDGSEFYGNGSGSGSTHNIYIGDIATFTLTNSYIHDANVGHEVKSRAENNIITNNRIEDGSSTASYQIDLPNGGNATISGNVIQKSANSGNHVTIAYGEEYNASATNSESKLNAGSSVSITGNTFVSDQSGAYVIWNATNAAVSASKNSIYNYNQIDRAGHVSSDGFTTLGSRPTLDTSSHIDTSGGSSSGSTPTPTSDTTAPTLTVTESASGITNRPSDTVSGTATDSGSGVAKIEIYDYTNGRTVDLGTASLKNGAFSFAVAGLADGSHAFSAVATDAAGNASAAVSAGAALIVDTVAPTLTATASVSGTTTRTSTVISGTATDVGVGVSRVEVYDTTGGSTVDLGAATLTGSSWSFNATKLATGTHAFSAIATDAAGNASASVAAGSGETIVATSTPPVNTSPVNTAPVNNPPVNTPPVTTQPAGPAVVPVIGSASLAGGGLQLNGTAQAGSTVTLTSIAGGNTRTVGSVTAGNDGTWHIGAGSVNSQVVNKFLVSATSGSTTTAGSASLTLASTNSELLTGTAGKADLFAFAGNSGLHYISGFETGRDVIDMVGSAYHSFNDIQAKFTGSGSTIISTGPTSGLGIVGVDPSNLTAANFRFT